LPHRAGTLLAWIWLVAIDLALRAGYLAPRLRTARGIANYLLAAVVLYLVLRLLATLGSRLRAALLVVTVALPIALQTAAFRAYGQFFETADLDAALDSPRMLLSAGSFADGVATPVVFLLSCASIALFARTPAPLPRRRVALAGAAIAGLLALGATYWRASPNLQHPQAAFGTALAGLARRATASAQTGARIAVPRPADAQDATAATGAPRLPNLVLVLGESLAASHLTLYGYPEDTSPRLRAIEARGELIAFRDAVVMGPNTRTSLPYIVTGLEGPDPGGRVARAPTVLEYAKARGYHTAVVSAQEEAWGNLDALLREGADTFRTGIQFAADVDVMKGGDDLVVLEQGVLPAIRTLAEPFFLVVHMDGSHAPYGHHSPASRKVFVPEDGVNSTRAYDNTVRVTDEFVARTLEALRSRDPGAWMFFTSDHGQALGEGGAFFNRGYQTNVVKDPLLVFPPPDLAPADRAPWESASTSQVAACDLAPTLVHLMRMTPAPGAPMDCADWLAAPPLRRVRVVSAYTPTFVAEPTMLVLLPDGERALYDLGRGTVTLGEGAVLPIEARTIPPDVAARLATHP